MLYQTYQKLFKKGDIFTGFSHRLPDYANKYWFDQLEKVINTTPKRSFLDIGAGGGRLSRLLLEGGFEKGTAIEVAVDKNAWGALLKQYSNMTLHEGMLQEKMQELVAQGKTFDFILLSELFEHIPLDDVDVFLSVLKKLLAIDGKIYLTTPNFVVQGPAEESHMWHEREPWGHHKHYKFSEVKELLQKHGFAVEWHTFECNVQKSKSYNRYFYPAARWDARFLYSKKLPAVVRAAYKIASYPAALVAKGIFWFLAQRVNANEARSNTEQNAGTMVLCIRNTQ